MLKSHFNLVVDDEEPNVEEEQEIEVVSHEGDEVPDRFLSKSEVSVRLSMLGKTSYGDGTKIDDSKTLVVRIQKIFKLETESVKFNFVNRYTYLKATITGLKLTHIEAIKSFHHLLFLDLSNNSLDIHALQAITELPFLVLIQADKNKLSSAGLKSMKYLQVIIMNSNQITTVHDVFHEQLSTLEVGYNKIEKIVFASSIPTLKVLDFQYNLLTEVTNMNFPLLDSLYVAGNKIKSLVGIETLVNLRILHVRNNPIKLLDGFDKAMAKLQYINLRNCKVATLKQIKKLRVLPVLDTLVLVGTPYMGGNGDEEDPGTDDEDPELRVEILAIMLRLKRINKDPVTPEERDDAKVLIKQRLKYGEKDEEEVEDETAPEEETTNEE